MKINKSIPIFCIGIYYLKLFNSNITMEKLIRNINERRKIYIMPETSFSEIENISVIGKNVDKRSYDKILNNFIHKVHSQLIDVSDTIQHPNGSYGTLISLKRPSGLEWNDKHEIVLAQGYSF